MQSSDRPVVVAALRTPIGTAGRSLARVDAAGLAAPLLRRLVASVPAPAPTEVVLGNCTGPGCDVARVATLAAGLPVEVPALTVDRQCGSGLAAITTADRLGRLRPTIRPEGTVTPGNSCGVNDGAAVVALVDAATHADLGTPGLRVLATATAGVDPNRPGIGIVPAVRTALDRAGLRLGDLDVIELNEAFAGQVLACCDELGLEPERVCRQGGALALGHPWGASGAVLVVRLFSQLVRERRGRYGLAAIAVGGSQGVAMVVELSSF